MMRKIIPCLISVLMGVSGIQAAVALDETRPLYIHTYDQGLWTWQPGDAEPKQITESDCAARGAFSPDGRYMVCTQFTEGGFAIGLDEFTVANNVYLFDMETLEAAIITTQPDDISPEKFIVRTRPVWSPDGQQFAWTEFFYPQRNQNLMIYDLGSEGTTTLLEQMAAEADAPLAQLAWSEAGIAYDYNVFETSGGGLLHQSVTILTPQGEIRYAADVQIITPRVRFTFGGTWVMFEGRWQYAELFNDATWQVFDPELQQTTIIEAQPVLRMPETDLRIVFEPQGDDYNVYAVDRRRSFLTSYEYLFDLFNDKVALSPDGRQLAYMEGYGVSVWVDGRVTSVPLADIEAVRWITWGSSYIELEEVP